MLTLGFERVRHILCLGSHADDIEIGCGGTILKLLAANPAITVHWVVLSASNARQAEAVRSAEQFLRNARVKRVVVKQYTDTAFPYEGSRIKAYFAELRRTVTPDAVFTHRREDLHQDHRVVSELTWSTFREQPIFEYEIPKYEGDLGQPNVFVPLDQATCAQKVDTIVNTFATQASKPWFSPDAFWALLRLRGVESKSPSRFAEAMHCRKLTLS